MPTQPTLFDDIDPAALSHTPGFDAVTADELEAGIRRLHEQFGQPWQLQIGPFGCYCNPYRAHGPYAQYAMREKYGTTEVPHLVVYDGRRGDRKGPVLERFADELRVNRLGRWRRELAELLACTDFNVSEARFVSGSRSVALHPKALAPFSAAGTAATHPLFAAPAGGAADAR